VTLAKEHRGNRPKKITVKNLMIFNINFPFHRGFLWIGSPILPGKIPCGDSISAADLFAWLG
jgi:hypothetical protein